MPATLPLPPAVLVVDDAPYVRAFLVSLLGMYLPADAIVSANDGRDALQYFDNCAIPVLITDHQMPNLTGLELIDIVKARYPDTRIILISGDVQNNIQQRGYEHGADYVLAKPFRVTELRGILEQMFPPSRNERAVGCA